ncbi:unnamed protein product [Blepharisma stoltei]|uniref:Uncharacterized protein n=1 Tax=Blepharisma stoltei TaxID=1481888 RepID=A0AAU9JRI5_9CILI|nr:unnamed protein product [Blepharisma stoltei]
MESFSSPYGFMFDHLQGIEDIVLNINKLAMEALHENDFNTSVTLLHRANHMLRQQPVNLQTIKLRAITLNNLGCLYKRTNQNPKALQFLKEALECEKKLPGDYTNIAGTHLNICAIKSLLNHHEESLAHALKAINIIQQNPFLDEELIRSLVVAYYNAGTEYQYLHRNSEATAFLRHGHNLSSKHLGKNHPLTLSFGIGKNEKNKKSKRGKLKPIDFELINKSLDLEEEKIDQSAEKNEESLLPDIFSKSRAQTIRNNDGIQLDTTPWIDDGKEKKVRGYFSSSRNNKTKKIPLEERKSISNEISTPRRSYKIPQTLREKIEKFSMSPKHEDSFDRKLGHKAGNKSEGQVVPFKFNSSLDKDSLTPSKNIVKNKVNSQTSTIKSDKQLKPKSPAKLNPITNKNQAKPAVQNIFQIKKDQNKSPFITYESPIPTVKRDSTNSTLPAFSKDTENSPNVKNHKSSNSSLPRTKDSSNSPFPSSKTKDSSSSPMPSFSQASLAQTPPKKAVSPLSSNVKTRLNSIDDKLSTLQDRLNTFENKIQPLKELTEVEEDTISNISVPPDNAGKRVAAAIKIQAKFKGWKEHQKYKKIKESIIKIQKNVRGWICKKNYQKIKKNAIVIQKYVKGWICRENYAKLKLELKNQKNFGQQFGTSLVKTEDIQSQTDLNMRDPILSAIHLAPSKTLANKSLLSIVSLIQAHIRGFLKRKWYKKTKNSILLIQRAAKKYKFCRLYKEILHAIIFIQAMYRGYRVRKHYKRPLKFGENAVFKSIKVW